MENRMTRAELESIIEQELISELKEKHKKPSREELLNLVAAVDKESSHKKEQHEEMLSLDEDDSKYYSAGSVNNKLDRKMSPSQIARRKEIGRKIIDAISKPKKERTPAERSLRKALQSSRDTKGPQPNNPYWKSASWEQKINSFAWALASDYVLKKSGTFNIDKRIDKEYRAKNRANKRGAAGQQPGGATTTGTTQEPPAKEKPTTGPTGGSKAPTAPSAEKPKTAPTAPSAEKPKKEPTPPKGTPTTPRPKISAPSAKEPTPPKGTPTSARPKISAPSAKEKPLISRSSNKYSGLTDPQKKKLTSIIRAQKDGQISKKDAAELMNRELEKISGISRKSNQYTGLEPVDRFRLAAITKNLKNKELSPAEKERLEKIKTSIQRKAKTARGRQQIKEYAKFIYNKLNNSSALNEQQTSEHVFMSHVLYEIITVLGESL